VLSGAAQEHSVFTSAALAAKWVGSTSSYSFQMQRATLLEFRATLGQEPEIELALV
jgi:hypothetical protein